MIDHKTEKTPKNKALRVLIYSLVYYPRFVGGAEVALKEITDRIDPSSILFDMLTLHTDSRLPRVEQIGNVRIHRIGFACGVDQNAKSFKVLFTINKYAFPIFSCIKAIHLERQHHYTGIWSMMATYSGFGALFHKILFPRVRFLLTLQEGDSFGHILGRVGIFRPLFKLIFKKADKVQAISQYLATFAKTMGHTGEVEVVPNGVDTAYFSKRFSDAELFAIKNNLNKAYVDRFLITTSRLVKKNGVDLIIQALQFLPKEVKLLVLGVGDEYASLEKLAHELKVTDRVRFIGYVSHEEMPTYLAVSDVFIRPSRSEGFGNSFIEAMAAGIPVIATPVGGIVDFLYDPNKNPSMKSTGIFAEVENPKSIADGVTKILSNDALRGNLIENAREMVIERYDWSLVAREMERLIKKV